MGELNKAMQDWQQSISIDSKFAESKLALAVALFTQGKQAQAYVTAEGAIGLDRNFAKIEYVKEQNWGEKLLADTQKLMATPNMKTFMSRSNR